VLEKNHIIRYDKIDNVFRERKIAEELSGHPNIVQFEATFQDDLNLYFLLEYVEQGSLSELLKQLKSLPPKLT
jgi:3-phosphoinositide dependent protein kinase-1